MKNIIIISDGIPGHFNQSKGVVSLLNELHSCNITIHQMSWKVYFLRSIFIILARLFCKMLNKLTASMIVSMYSSVDIKDADLIIAAGGNTAPYNAALKFLYNKPAIQLGSPRGIHSSLFSGLVTVDKYFDDPSNIIASLTPNSYSPKKCLRAAKENNMQQHLLFLIGGEGIGYLYEDDEWDSLIRNIKDLHKNTSLPITIVTSRRTNPIIENKLRSELSEVPLSYSAWFHKGDKDFHLDALLGSAKAIFVTEDSAMMISESISSGNPVSTLYPLNIQSPERYQKHIKKYLDLGFIKRQSINNFRIIDELNITEIIDEYQSSLLHKIIERIGW